MPGLRGLVDMGEIAVVKHSVQIELAAQLTGGKAVQFVAQGSSPQQIGGAPPDLARAGAAKREMQTAVFDEPVRLVKQGWNFLHLVNDNLSPRILPLRLDLFPKRFRMGKVAAKLLRFQQVNPARILVGGPQQGAFASLPRPPKEKRRGARRRKSDISREHEAQYTTII